ncbi:hypothetical protein ACTFIY_001570 [Dictyostelium cf. discoideum]
MAIFNLVDQASSYGAYHHNTVNKFIHIVFVPLILLTAFIFVDNLPHSPFLEDLLIPLNSISNGLIPVALSTPLAIALSLYYCILDVRVGLASMLWINAANYAAVYSINTYGLELATYYGTIIHIVSWISQFIGHGVFEGRRPALITEVYFDFLRDFGVIVGGVIGSIPIIVRATALFNVLYNHFAVDPNSGEVIRFVSPEEFESRLNYLSRQMEDYVALQKILNRYHELIVTFENSFGVPISSLQQYGINVQDYKNKPSEDIPKGKEEL